MNDIIEITIFCNQTDCLYCIKQYANLEEKLYTCHHLHPSIQKYPIISKTLCRSKERNMKNPFDKEKDFINAVRKDRCNECGQLSTKNCENCLNIPPELKKDE